MRNFLIYCSIAIPSLVALAIIPDVHPNIGWLVGWFGALIYQNNATDE